MQGHIRRRGKDSWAVVINLGRDPLTRKRRQLWRSVKGRKRDAEALLAQLIHQRDTGIDQPPGKIALGEFLERWLVQHAVPNVAPATLNQYQWAIRRRIAPVLGAIPLTKLRPAHIQEFYARVQAEGLSAKSTLHLHRLLREALQHGVLWQVLSRNPAAAVESPRPRRYEPIMLSVEDSRRVLTVAQETPLGALIHTALMTGLRRGELLGLRWRDLDFDGATLHVQQTAQWLAGRGWEFREPKTSRSRRPVALASVTIDVLKEHRRKQLEERLALGPGYQDFDLAFASPAGTPTDPAGLRRKWKRIAAAAGLPTLRFHDLRHAHATLMLVSGVHPKVVSERLGHSTVAITMDTYSHVLPHIQSEAAQGLERLLAIGGSKGRG